MQPEKITASSVGLRIRLLWYLAERQHMLDRSELPATLAYLGDAVAEGLTVLSLEACDVSSSDNRAYPTGRTLFYVSATS